MTSQNKTVKMFVEGQWKNSRGCEETTAVMNPSTGKEIARCPIGTVEDVNEAVASASAALEGWAETPIVERARVMFAYRELIEENFDDLARLLTREHGKTHAEAKAEVQRGLEMVEFACGIPAMIAGQTFPQIARGVDGETNRHPVGVCVGITPYNFPNMVPMWMFPIAITCGNTFVLKPSEKVPLSAIRLIELLVDAGVPKGVVNLVHGGKTVVDALLRHQDVAAISFVGSTTIAKYVYEVGCAHGKRVQSAGGAKNHLIIMPDADLDQSVKALAASAFGCAGQRCMAGSVAVAVGSVGDSLIDGLMSHAASMKVGLTDGNDATEMGPVISGEHRDRVAGYLDSAASSGASVVLDGRNVDAGDSFLLGPSVVDQVTIDMPLWKEEVFGPLLSVVRADSLEQAIEVGKACPFGNGASVFTQSGYVAREFKRHFNAGMIGVNVGVPAPMAWLPFTGWNQSFFGDLHIQGTEGVQFYTRQKMTLTRWFASKDESHVDPVWNSDGPGKK
ncbi:Methylmalonate-semialdehyde dehydrogenase [acylating] [Rubripirellula obstinata]|uniref:methylmalonate-semialdehyde dehydrogenase (CoA acylating) n=1 Tax=Rubripirellula obstinata TaxID=406547 RepID=A0A5B1CL55_9BACT|nr:CoA-acylating methylmalonate-semialdehyde dehydrogenase [Rubripirellula obstinata]KAA1260123.1 Methylmalonate-semialdehyde dehydrogenase [acylating] [Rubripirellula obstinata]